MRRGRLVSRPTRTREPAHFLRRQGPHSKSPTNPEGLMGLFNDALATPLLVRTRSYSFFLRPATPAALRTEAFSISFFMANPVAGVI